MKPLRSVTLPLSTTGAFIVLALPAAAAAGPSDCKPLATVQTTAIGGATKVAYQFTPGQLEPQIRRLLQQQLAIKVLDWQASPHHQWPTDYRIEAGNWIELLQRVLHPYHLQLVVHANESAVVRYRDASTQL